MKPKNIFKYLMIAFLAMQLSSCTTTEAEQKFDETPTERLNGRKKELNDVLLSSPFGWKAVYYTDDSQFGGFTHLFKFLPDGKVAMASDFDNDIDTYNSQYDIQLGSTVSLVFTTKSRIHLLSDSGNSPLAAGKGYLGDFQFLYYGQENGNIIFKTNRTLKELRFIKATAQDWADLPKSKVMMNNMVGTSTSPLFRLLETNDGTKKHPYEFDFTGVTRFGTATSLETGNFTSLNLAVAYTPTGIKVKPAVVVNGQSLTDFAYTTDGTFVATGTGGVFATIKYTNVPPVLTNDYKTLLTGASGVYGYIDEFLYDAPETSKLCQDLIDEVNKSLPAGQKLIEIDLNLNPTTSFYYIAYIFEGRPNIFHVVNATGDDVTKTIKFTHRNWNGIAPPVFLRKIDNELTNSKGLYAVKESYNVYYNNTVWTFTSASSSFRISTYKF
jgi:hypothetical protein